MATGIGLEIFLLFEVLAAGVVSCGAGCCGRVRYTLSGDQQVAGSGVCASQPTQYEHTVQYPVTDLPDLRDSALDLTLQV